MRTLILVYSLSGHSAAYAATAGGANYVTESLREARRRSRLTAFVPGVWQAVRAHATQLHPLRNDPREFDTVWLIGPIWAGRPAPALNAAADALPKGTSVRVTCLAAGGTGDLAALTARLKTKGCAVTAAEVIKG